MPERFDAGTALIGLGAVLLLVSLFVDWFAPGGDAWAVFEWVDVFLAGVAIATLAALVPRFTGLASAVVWLAVAALAVVAIQLIDLPPAARASERETGAWLALAATAVMALGAALAAASVSITVNVGGRERRRRTVAIDAREGAPPAADRAGPGPEPTPKPATDPQRTQPLDRVDPPGDAR